MALVYRDGRPYLYRSRRAGDRVTSEYVASGEAALLIDEMERIDREKADFRRWRVEQEQAGLDELERALAEEAGRALDAARLALTTAGYHRPKRGPWRRRRGRRHRSG